MSNRQTRRTALGIMGLAGLGGAAVATERVTSDDQVSWHPQLDTISPLRAADALQKLVDGLRSGHIVPEGFQITSSLGKGSPPSDWNNDWLEQRLSFGFYVALEPIKHQETS